MKIVKIGLTQKLILNRNSSVLVWLTALFLFLIISLVKKEILPNYFFFDEAAIATYISQHANFQIGDSYASTAAFYNALYIESSSIVYSLLSAILVTYAIYLAQRMAKTNSTSLLNFIIIAFFSSVTYIYITMLSKETIVLLVIIPLFYLSKRGTWGLLFWSTLAALYATYFRSYWSLLIAESFGIYFVFRFTRSPLLLLLAIPASLLIMSILFNLFLGSDLDSFRTSVNETRLQLGDENSRTMILPWLTGGGIFISWANSCITWLTLILPIPLFILASPYYILNATFIVLLYYKVFVAAFNELKSPSSNQLIICISVTISFTVVQSIFEPDYGSYIKHLSPFYPLIFYIILKTSNQRSTSSAPTTHSTRAHHYNLKS